MLWFKPNLRNSLYGLLGHSVQPSESRYESALEDIREAMLELLETGGADPNPALVRRIRYAADVQALWYLRGDLMAVLAATQGEARARTDIHAISCMFKGLLPSSIPVPVR